MMMIVIITLVSGLSRRRNVSLIYTHDLSWKLPRHAASRNNNMIVKRAAWRNPLALWSFFGSQPFYSLSRALSDRTLFNRQSAAAATAREKLPGHKLKMVGPSVRERALPPWPLKGSKISEARRGCSSMSGLFFLEVVRRLNSPLRLGMDAASSLKTPMS